MVRETFDAFCWLKRALRGPYLAVPLRAVNSTPILSGVTTQSGVLNHTFLPHRTSPAMSAITLFVLPDAIGHGRSYPISPFLPFLTTPDIIGHHRPCPLSLFLPFPTKSAMAGLVRSRIPFALPEHTGHHRTWPVSLFLPFLMRSAMAGHGRYRPLCPA